MYRTYNRVNEIGFPKEAGNYFLQLLDESLIFAELVFTGSGTIWINHASRLHVQESRIQLWKRVTTVGPIRSKVETSLHPE